MIATDPALSAATRSSSAGGPALMRSCFEVFGFDVLLDAQLRAWLLEVNTRPALNADSPLDMIVKTNMVRRQLTVTLLA
jgi:D-alanine-D-alanine ligase-like ATP-grasp enzyme